MACLSAGALVTRSVDTRSTHGTCLSPHTYSHKTYLSLGSKTSDTNSIASDHRGHHTALPYIEVCGYDSRLLQTSRQDKQLWVFTFDDIVGTSANVILHRDVPAPPLPVVMVPLGRRPVSALPHKRASSGKVLPSPTVRPAS